MMDTVALQIPADIYHSLTLIAAKTGNTPEKLASQWLLAALEQTADDPVEEFIGGFESNIIDWCDRHDDYLGDAELNG